MKAGYKWTEAGVIPDDWSAKPIGNYIDLLTGCPFPSIGYSKSGVRLLRGSNVKRGETDWGEDITQYWPTVTPHIARYQLKQGDLVIAMDGSLVGRSFAQLSSRDVPALLLQRVARIRSSQLDVTYLTALVGSDRFIKYADSVKTVTAIPHISPGDIRKFTIPVPPTLAEQRAIAAALSDVDALLDGLNRLIAKKRDLKQAAMQQLLTGQTRLPGFQGEWEVKRLGELTDIVSGGTPRTNELSYWNGGIKWCTPTDITHSAGKYLTETERTISRDGLNSSGARLLPVGALLLCSRATIGELKIAGTPICTNQGFKSLVCRPRVSNEFLYYKLLTMKQQMVVRAFGSTFLEISTQNVSSLEVATPPHDEQTAIAAVLSDMDAELAALGARYDKTRALKQAMMQELLTGKTRLV